MNFFTRGRIFASGVICLVSLGAFFAVQYRQYAYAMIWHHSHSAKIKFGEHEIEIPRLWWAGKFDNYGQISILRASRSSVFFEPKIEVSPATVGQVADSDEEQLHLASKVVASENSNAQAGWTFSVTRLQAKSSTWYCIRDAQAIFGSHVFTNLTCNAPRIRYTLNYQGPPKQEKEAESIFATFR